MSLLNKNFISEEHKKFVEMYGEDFLDEIIDDFCSNEIKVSFFNGNPYQETSNFSIEHEDEKNNLLWEISFYSNIGDFMFESFSKYALH